MVGCEELGSALSRANIRRTWRLYISCAREFLGAPESLTGWFRTPPLVNTTTWDDMTADRRHTWRTRCTGGTCSACWSQHTVFADDHGHVVIEVLAAKSELFARPLPNREGVRTCERVTSLEIVIVQALAKSRSDIDVEVDIDDHNLRVLVYRLCHSKETGVSYGSSNTCLAAKCSLFCGTSDASQCYALQSHRRRSLVS